MTATTFSRLPLMAGSVVAATLGRAGHWTLSRYMRAPLASTGLLAMVTLTALAASNALYFQTARHPAPFFAPAMDVPVPVTQQQIAPEPQAAPVRQLAPTPMATETTGSVAVAPPVIPSAPVGNREAFAVQKKLTELGLFNGTVDGFYGPMTANSIRAFELRNGMTPTGALTRDVIDAILRADAYGVAPVAQQAVVQPAPQPVYVQPAPPPVLQQAAVQPVAQPDRVVARLPTLTPVDQAVDAVGAAAAQTLDTIIAAVDGARSTPSQAMPAPVQVASLEPMAPPRPVTAVQAQPVPQQIMAAVDPDIAPANNAQLVGQIQKGLASLGFYHGSIDGHPGDGTAKAIREFENFHSYQVTGQVKPDLVDLLRQAGASI